MSTSPAQFSIARLHLWLLIASLACAFVLSLSVTVISTITALIVIGCFMLADAAWQRGWKNRLSIAVAYYTFAFAIASFLMLVTLFIFTPPRATVQPFGLFQFMQYLIFGVFIDDLASELAKAISIVLSHFLATLFFTCVSFFCSVGYWNQDKTAKWIVIGNSPGMLLIVYLLIISVAATR